MGMKISKVIHVDDQPNRNVIEVRFSEFISLECNHWFEVLHDRNLEILHEAKDRKLPVFITLNGEGTKIDTVELIE